LDEVGSLEGNCSSGTDLGSLESCDCLFRDKLQNSDCVHSLVNQSWVSNDVPVDIKELEININVSPPAIFPVFCNCFLELSSIGIILDSVRVVIFSSFLLWVGDDESILSSLCGSLDGDLSLLIHDVGSDSKVLDFLDGVLMTSYTSIFNLNSD
jgi:hypothetical protein